MNNLCMTLGWNVGKAPALALCRFHPHSRTRHPQLAGHLEMLQGIGAITDCRLSRDSGSLIYYY
jgi:hypothetical protein